MEPVAPFIREIALPIFLGVSVWGLAALFALKEFGSRGLKWFLATTIVLSGGVAAFFFLNAGSGEMRANRYGNIMLAVIGTIIGFWTVLVAFFFAISNKLSKIRPETETN